MMENTKLPFKFRNSIEINNIGDFNCVGQDIISDLVSEIMTDERYLHSSICEETGNRYFNQKGTALIDRTQQRLGKLARKYFSEDDLDDLDLEPYNLITD